MTMVTLPAPFHTALRMASQPNAPPPMITTCCMVPMETEDHESEAGCAADTQQRDCRV